MGKPRIVIGALVLSLAVPSSISSHEIKALASQLSIEKPGTKTTVYLSWGHRLPVDDLIDGSSLERYDLLAPSGTTTALKRSELSLQANVVEVKETGTYQVLVGRKAGIYTYVFDEDGSRLLKRGPKSAIKEGKIDYALRSQQFAKALIVVGPASTGPIKPAALPIEITPLDSPAAWKSGQTLRFQVLLQGKPLSAANVTARYVGFKPDNGWCYATTTNRDGEVCVRPCQGGIWVLKVNSRLLARDAAREQYDFDSYTATLTLEIQP
ncbi:MAG TPA: DUF4198 domain-containing protein [Gemmataceae bacterium]|nr:DUF4198 domain-containing protein [Gemmataceae bacterium]